MAMRRANALVLTLLALLAICDISIGPEPQLRTATLERALEVA
ncbi:hypothetical protein PC129_g1044 [Phytophthora cactorum]|uniref:RxLR effector protein n=1 Tax=Phytophthora cactorum TaxID=29920 RepID=A0A329RFV2_9STRA|nr:hypothetical protein Pcac1_g15432 [Phytophthora cactorum]KAG2838769.1 hypothetical protein PC112_g4386 [Phytophthora cactorum]KAG2840762.1 hypothetical protein PC111_g3372 [Phytophthora cactorum]KAG2864815.1 hypothetical protein PC113_g4276 [Phytophthora cactorum]KAG2923850.1 hypothetical protein PC114_g4698 [Phytophthora cactorum]